MADSTTLSAVRVNLPEGPGPWVELLLPADSVDTWSQMLEEVRVGDPTEQVTIDTAYELCGRLLALWVKNHQYGRLPADAN